MNTTVNLDRPWAACRSDLHRRGPLILGGAGWLSLALVAAQMLRLESAFAHPQAPFEFLPGWARFAGLPANRGVNWLQLLSLSGAAWLVSWTWWLEGVGTRFVADWGRARPKVLAGPVVAWLVLVLWGLDLGHRRMPGETLPAMLLIHLAVLAGGYGILGSGLSQVRSQGVRGLLLALLPTVILACQVQGERWGMREPNEAVFLWGSLPIGLAVVMRLGIWAWAEPPPLEARRA